MTKKRIVVGVLGVVLVAVLGFGWVAKIAPLSWGMAIWGPINASSGVAIHGYDPVSFHADGVAELGSASTTWTWGDVEWRFVSTEHRALFQAAPEKYAPQFGGYCAYAASKGLTADTDPEFWHLEDGKLYLFPGDGPRQDWLGERKPRA